MGRSSSIGDRDAIGDAYLINAARDQLKTMVEAAVVRRPRHVEPLHDDLVAADPLHVIVQQQQSGLGVSRRGRGRKLADNVDEQRAQLNRGGVALGYRRHARQRISSKRLWSAQVV